MMNVKRAWLEMLTPALAGAMQLCYVVVAIYVVTKVASWIML